MQNFTFTIEKLFGEKDYSLEVKDGILILVAENGSGKTTILHILYLFLSKQWEKIYQLSGYIIPEDEEDYEEQNLLFKSLILEIGDEEISFFPNLFKDRSFDWLERKTRFGRQYEMYTNNISDFFDNLAQKGWYEFNYEEQDQLHLAEKYNMPLHIVTQMLLDIKLAIERTIEAEIIDFPVIYLPTYRRIEKSFTQLYSDIGQFFVDEIKGNTPPLYKEIEYHSFIDENEEDNDENNEFEDGLIESKDYELYDWDTLKNKLNLSSVYINYSENKHIEHNKYLELSEFGMNDVLKKTKDFRNNAHLNENVEALKKMDLFLTIINEYCIGDKKIILSESTLKLVRNNKELPISMCSSGEKQIISLFCYVILSETPPLIIIDEPELSLSLKWQKRIVADILRANINALICATHSPFVIPENLKKNTHGLNEFLQTNNTDNE